MTVLHSGATKKYADNFSLAFGRGAKKGVKSAKPGGKASSKKAAAPSGKAKSKSSGKKATKKGR